MADLACPHIQGREQSTMVRSFAVQLMLSSAVGFRIYTALSFYAPILITILGCGKRCLACRSDFKWSYGETHIIFQYERSRHSLGPTNERLSHVVIALIPTAVIVSGKVLFGSHTAPIRKAYLMSLGSHAGRSWHTRVTRGRRGSFLWQGRRGDTPVFRISKQSVFRFIQVDYTPTQVDPKCGAHAPTNSAPVEV